MLSNVISELLPGPSSLPFCPSNRVHFERFSKHKSDSTAKQKPASRKINSNIALPVPSPPGGPLAVSGIEAFKASLKGLRWTSALNWISRWENRVK